MKYIIGLPVDGTDNSGEHVFDILCCRALDGPDKISVEENERILKKYKEVGDPKYIQPYIIAYMDSDENMLMIDDKIIGSIAIDLPEGCIKRMNTPDDFMILKWGGDVVVFRHNPLIEACDVSLRHFRSLNEDERIWKVIPEAIKQMVSLN